MENDMGRPKGSFTQPTYRLHKASGQAIVTIDRKDYYLGKYDTPASRSAYDRHVAEWLMRGRQGPSASDPNLATISQLCAAYISTGNPKNRATLKQSIRWMRDMYGDTRAADFGPLALKALRAKLCTAEVQRKWAHRTLSRKYINDIVMEIFMMFRWAVENQIVPPSALQALQSIRKFGRGDGGRETEPVKPVAQADIDAVLEVAPRVVGGMIRMQLLTAARPGEIRLMRTCDIDMSGNVWKYRPHQHKGTHRGQDRVIFIGPKAQEILRPFLKPDLQAYIFSPRDAYRDFYSRSGKQSFKTGRAREVYSIDSYCNVVVGLCRKADRLAHERNPTILDNVRLVNHWHPHQLRHNAATMLRQEYGVDHARVVLGHRAASVTEVYAEVDYTKAEQAMAEVG